MANEKLKKMHQAFDPYEDYVENLSYTPGTVTGASEIKNAAAPNAAQLMPLGDAFKKLGGFAKAHPWQTAGTGLNAIGNVSGLLDNDKLLGQVGGTALGALAPKILGMAGIAAPGPLGVANLAMLGGNLGALFDTLRAKKEQEQALQSQYYGGQS